MRDSGMREFWDARAAEDAYYFVDNRLDYRRPEAERFWAAGDEIVETMLERLGVKIEPTDTVVEIGCGIGRVTRALAARAARVVALDVSPRMLESGRRLNPDLHNVAWLLGDGRSLSGIDSESADVCHSFVVFQHIPDPEITLGYVREMGRVLRPGGWAGFQVSNLASVHRRPSWGRRVMGALGTLALRRPHGQAHPAWLGSAMDLDVLREAGSQAGLTTLRVLGEGTQHCLVLMRAWDERGVDGIERPIPSDRG